MNCDRMQVMIRYVSGTADGKRRWIGWRIVGRVGGRRSGNEEEKKI